MCSEEKKKSKGNDAKKQAEKDSRKKWVQVLAVVDGKMGALPFNAFFWGQAIDDCQQ